MDRPNVLRYAASAVAFGMAALLILLQTALTPLREAPLPLFLLFTALWGFGAVMLLVRPRFGAAGTTLWGFVSAAGAFRTHTATGPEDVALVGGSLAGALLAAATWFALTRRK